MAEIPVTNYTDLPARGPDLGQPIANLGIAGRTINFASTTANVQLLSPRLISSNVTIYGGSSSGLQPRGTIVQVAVGNVPTVAAGANVALAGAEVTGGNETGNAIPLAFSTGSIGSQGSDGTISSRSQSDLGIQNVGTGGIGGTGASAITTWGTGSSVPAR